LTKTACEPAARDSLRMPGGPTGGPYGGKSKTIWNDEFIATEIGQIGAQMDALGHLGCMCGVRGDKTSMLLLQRQSPIGHVVALRAEQARHRKCTAVLHPRRPV
jgi:hypothetical protein